MNNTARSILGIGAIVVVALALVGGGVFFGQMSGASAYGRNMTLAPARSAGVSGFTSTGNSAVGATGAGIMGGGMMSGNMMGGTFGMMSAARNAALYGVQPLSISAAQNAVQTYLTGLRNSDLTVGEVIIFDNQAYARIDEKGTGHAALEVLVDPVTLAVYPEPGANMMWNLKYGMMTGLGAGAVMTHAPARSAGVSGIGTGMMGGATTANPNDPMPVTSEQAVETAQRYLDTYLPGAKAETTGDAFYGYYTLEILRNGQTTGMLSVNGYTRQVILHTWHGRFIETSAK